MSTFTPPANANEVGSIDADTPALARRLLRWHGGNPRARNVYILDGTTVTENDPVATYNADGSVNQYPEERVTRFFQGAASHTVNAAEVTLLTDAGFGANIT